MSELLWWHRVGQKVVCVNSERINGGYGDEALPESGAVYTVREVKTSFNSNIGRFVYFLLDEIRQSCRSYYDGYEEPGFWADRFRPVRTTDISSLVALLHPTPDDARPFFEEIVKEAEHV